MKTNKNIIVRFASGMIGHQLVAREWKGRSYLSNAPNFGKNRQFSEEQLSRQERFADAMAYAKAVLDHEDLKEIYSKKAKRVRLLPVNVAVRDYLKPPEIRDIDESRYAGKAGDEIVVRAVDDMEVVGVLVSLKRDGEIVEEGDAIRDKYNKNLWRYIAQTEIEVIGVTIEAYACDRPGSVAKAEITLGLNMGLFR